MKQSVWECFQEAASQSHQHCGILGAFRRFLRGKDKKLGEAPSRHILLALRTLDTKNYVFIYITRRMKTAIKALWASLKNLTKMIRGDPEQRCHLSKRGWNLWLQVRQCKWPRQNAGTKGEWLRRGKPGKHSEARDEKLRRVFIVMIQLINRFWQPHSGAC